MLHTRYGALRTIAAVLKVLAWVVGAGCGLGFVVALLWAAVEGSPEPLAIGIGLLLYAVLGFIYLYASSEGIHVILDIEANTRRAGEILERLTQQPGSPQEPRA